MFFRSRWAAASRGWDTKQAPVPPRPPGKISGTQLGDLGEPGQQGDYEELGRTTPVLVCGRSHPLHGRARARKRDLVEHASVVPRFLGRATDAPLDQFPEWLTPRRVGATIELLQMGVQLVIEGAYLGYFPEVSIRRALEDGRLWRLRGVRGATPFSLRALTRTGAPRRPVVERVIDEVRERVRSATR